MRGSATLRKCRDKFGGSKGALRALRAVPSAGLRPLELTIPWRVPAYQPGILEILTVLHGGRGLEGEECTRKIRESNDGMLPS